VSFPVSTGMSENVATLLSSYTDSKLLYPAFVISLKKRVWLTRGQVRHKCVLQKWANPGHPK